MGSRHIRGPLVYNTYHVVLTGDYTVINESLVIVNKTVGHATQITLPPSLSTNGRRVIHVIDGLGDAATNNITIATTGADTINGGATLTLSINHIDAELIDLGAGAWVCAVPQVSGAGSFTTGSFTGLVTNSSADTLTALGTNQGTALQLTKQFNRVTVGASTTGVLLPLAVAGVFVEVTNSVANSIHVYGAGTDTINGIATATGIVQPPGTSFVYYCSTTAPAGKYSVFTNASNSVKPPTAQGTLTTVGAGALLSAVIAGGLCLRTGPTAAFIDTTDTGTQLAAALPNIQVGQSFEFLYQNSSYSVATLTGGTGINGAATFGSVGPGAWARWLFTYTAANTFTVVPVDGGDNWIGLPSTSYATGTTTTTFTAAQMTGGGAKLAIYQSTAATPGSIATATATAMFAAIPGAYVGLKWIFRVINDVATNSMTITADGSVTLSGKTTYIATPFCSMDFEMTFTSPTTATMKYIGSGQSTTV